MLRRANHAQQATTPTPVPSIRLRCVCHALQGFLPQLHLPIVLPACLALFLVPLLLLSACSALLVSFCPKPAFSLANPANPLFLWRTPQTHVEKRGNPAFFSQYAWKKKQPDHLYFVKTTGSFSATTAATTCTACAGKFPLLPQICFSFLWF